VNIYVINVHGRVNRTLKEEGTDKISRAFSLIMLFFKRNPRTEAMVMSIKTAILI
jgi:hypothetical protein